MASYTAHSAEHKCPICSKALEGHEYENATAQLEKSISQEYRDQTRKKKQEFEKKLSELKADQQKRIQAMAKKQQEEKQSFQQRLKDQARQGKETQERELKQLRRNFQMQLEQIREVYHNQNLALQNELKNSFAGQMDEMRKNYESIVTSNQSQLEMLQKWLEEKLIGDLNKKVVQLEQAKSSAETNLNKLVQQLDERNTEVVLLQERIKQLEDRHPESKRKEPPFDGMRQKDDYLDQDEEEDSEPMPEQHKELLNIIKEVAQEHQEMQGMEDDSPEGKKKFWGKKVAKKLGSMF